MLVHPFVRLLTIPRFFRAIKSKFMWSRQTSNRTNMYDRWAHDKRLIECLLHGVLPTVFPPFFCAVSALFYFRSLFFFSLPLLLYMLDGRHGRLQIGENPACQNLQTVHAHVHHDSAVPQR